jgi:hypothetical protein
MVTELASEGIISDSVVKLLRPLICIDNVVRAGQEVTSAEVEYVRQTVPGIQRWLHARRLALAFDIASRIR